MELVGTIQTKIRSEIKKFGIKIRLEFFASLLNLLRKIPVLLKLLSGTECDGRTDGLGPFRAVQFGRARNLP